MAHTTFNFAKLALTSLFPVATWAAIALPSAQTAQAQVIIDGRGVVSGTVVPPDINPNFNQGTTTIEVDAQGRYFRIGTTEAVYIAPDPNLVRMADDGTFFVDFRGIPVVGVEATLTSPVLSDGQLDSRKCCNHRAAPVFFTGTVQDELVLQGFYTGIATDPETGEQYQGTFRIRAQGPRYSHSTGGNSPTVFDFQSHYNLAADPKLQPTPTVDSVTFADMPVLLRVTVPDDLSPITPTPVAPTPVTPTPVTPTPVTPTPAVAPTPATPTPVMPTTVPSGPTTVNPIVPGGPIPSVTPSIPSGPTIPVTPPMPSLPAPTLPSLPNASVTPTSPTAPTAAPMVPVTPMPGALPGSGTPSMSAGVEASDIAAADYVIWQELQPVAEVEPRLVGPRSRVMLW